MTGTEQFIASLVHSLAWPVAVAVLVVVFRAQLTKLFDHPLQRLRAGPFEFEFERVAASVGAELQTAAAAPVRPDELEESGEAQGVGEEPAEGDGASGGDGGGGSGSGGGSGLKLLGGVSVELTSLAREAPAIAVLQAFAHVERRLGEILRDRIAFPSALSASVLARSALSAGLISAQAVSAIAGIEVLRNLCAQNLTEVGPDQALEYLTLVDGVLYLLRRSPRGRDDTE